MVGTNNMSIKQRIFRGMTKEVVISILGEPNLKNLRSTIFIYGTTELTFGPYKYSTLKRIKTSEDFCLDYFPYATAFIDLDNKYYILDKTKILASGNTVEEAWNKLQRKIHGRHR